MPRRKTDLVLVNPGQQHRIYQSLSASLTAIEPPVWAGLLASFIRQSGYEVFILDANAEGLGPVEVAERIIEMDPLLTAVVVYGHNPSASTQVMPAAGAICSALSEMAPYLCTLLLGGHVAALPERTLREESVDLVCGGEGPYTLLDLLEAFHSSASDFSKVRGLWYREGENILHTADAPLVRRLDAEMPGVAWDLLPMEAYRAHNWHCFGDLDRQPYAALYTTLGCPYHCSFCCIQAPFKPGESVLGYKPEINSYRMWSPDDIIRQIDGLVNRYGVKNIKIADEMFVLHPRHVAGICDRIIERGYDLNIWAYTRVDTVKEGMLDKMRQAGVRWLAFGVEAGSSRVLEDVHKGFCEESVLNTLEQVRSAGIHIGANYIFGLPEDDMESMEKTRELAIEINAEWANLYCAMAYPGSSLYTMALESGWPLPAEWSGYSQHAFDSRPLPTRYLSSEQVLRFRDETFQQYFAHPSYLAMIEKTFGTATVDEIGRMIAHPLDRWYKHSQQAVAAL